MPPTPTDYPHTPEPWCYVYGAAYQGTEDDVIAGEQSDDERGAVRLFLADRDDPRTRPVERDANLRRAVACVNACAGMADPGSALAEVREILIALLPKLEDDSRPGDRWASIAVRRALTLLGNDAL